MADNTINSINLVSFANAPQATADTYSMTEAQLLLGTGGATLSTDGSFITFNVMANDLGGTAKTLYSVDDGTSAGLPLDLVYKDADTTSTADFTTAWEKTASGNEVRIVNGKVEFRLTGQDSEAPGVTNIRSLDAGQTIHDSFVYAIRLANGTVSWTTVNVTITGQDQEATGSLSVSGSATEGGALTAALASVSDADGACSTSYQWEVKDAHGAWVCITDAAGANSNRLDLPRDQSYVGKEVRVVATTTDAFGGTTVFRSAAQTVANVEDEATGTVAIGAAAEGGTVTADVTGLSDADGGITGHAYQWQSSSDGTTWTDIAGATSASFGVPDDQSLVGKQVQVVVTTTDSFGGTTVVSSNAQVVANVEDEATGSVTIGAAAEGGTVTADVAALSDVDGGVTGHAYQWQSSSDGTTWTNIAGATSASYGIPDDQSLVGQQVHVVVTTTDSFGGQTDFTSNAQVVANVEDEAAGSVSIGAAAEGGSVTADVTGLSDADGGITGYSYQWQSSSDGATWNNIAGATSASYNIPDDQSLVGQQVHVVVTTTDTFGGSSQFISNPQTVANVEDEATGTVAIGAAAEGGTVTADVAGLSDVDGGVTGYAYQWQSSSDGTTWTDISGATSASYGIPDDQSLVGRQVHVVVTTTDGFGGTTDFTSNAQLVANVEDEATGSVSLGTAAEGSTVTADVAGLSDVDGGITGFAYQWQSSSDGTTWTDIAGAASASYGIPDDQSLVGQQVHVVVTTTDSFGGNSEFTSNSQTVANVEDEATGTVAIGAAAEGGTVTANVAGLSDEDGGITSYAYQWQSSSDGNTWTNIVGATSASYDIPDDQSLVGSQVHAVVTSTDAFGGTSEFTSNSQTVANVEDEATGTVAIGAAAEGGTVTANVAGLSDEDGGITGYAYQWQSSSDGTTWTDISGATSASYNIPGDQSLVGQQVQVMVTTTDSFGGSSEFTSNSQTVANVEDEATGTVEIGAAAEGGTVTANVAGLSDEDGGITSYAYQWQSSSDGNTWTNIVGATSASYDIPDDQSLVGSQVHAVVTSTDAFGGTSEFTSNSQTVANVEDEATGTVAISAAAEGGTVTADVAGLSDEDGGITGYAYQWQSSSDGNAWTNIAGATSASYGVPDDQSLVGSQLHVVVTTTDSFGGTTAVTSDAQVVANVDDAATGSVTIGTAAEGGTVTANVAALSDVDGTIASYAYQWQSSSDGTTWTNIPGATSASYTVPDDQSLVGQQVHVIVTTTDTFGGSSEFTSNEELVANVEDEATGSVTIGTASEGGTVTANVAALSDADGTIASYAYQWQSSSDGTTWTNIAGATGASYSIPDDQSLVGSQLHVLVTTTDGFGGSSDFTSNAQVVANVDDAATGTVSIGSTAEGGSVTADVAALADADGAITNHAYQWQSSSDGTTWTNIAGAIGASYAIADDQSLVGSLLHVVVTTTDSLGGSTEVTSNAQLVANVEDEASGAVTIGAAAEGGTVTADVTGLSDADGTIASVAYQWQSSSDGTTWTNIAGATSASYGIPGDQSLVGTQLHVLVTTTDGFGGSTDFTSNEQLVANVEDEATGTLAVSGAVKKGATVSANTAGLSDLDGGIASVAYQWQTSTDGTTWNAISGATASSFAIPNDFTYVGSYLRVTATTTDAYGGTTAFESSASLVGALKDDLFYVSNNTSGIQVSFDSLLANDVGLNGADITAATIIVGGNISTSLFVNTTTRMISFDTSGSTSDAILEYTVAGGDTARVTVKTIQTTGSDNIVSGSLTGSYAGSYIDLKNGDDTAISGGSVASDTFLGGSGNDTLSGGSAVDKISGGAGNDRIIGGASTDALTGGADHDTFVFDTALAGAGIDTISDFDASNPSAGHDFIELSSSVFGVTASGGLLSSSQFVSLATASSSYTSTTAKIVYDQATGNLYYDANGSVGGLADALVFATLTNKPTAMDATDIKVV